MRICGFAFSLVMIIVGSAIAQPDEATKKDFERIQGTWTVVKDLNGGGFQDGTVFVFRDAKFGSAIVFKSIAFQRSFHYKDFKLDATKSPKEIEMTDDKGEVYKGIYEIKDYTLKINIRGGKKFERPKDFEKQNDGFVLLAMREKP